MGTGYTRNDTGNNIADGNVINASDLDGEFDAVQAAFNGSTGHSHDGTTGEGPQIDTAGLADSAVETAKINNGAVTTDKLGADAVTGAKIGDDQIDSEHYVAGSIDREHLAADIIDGTKIADDVINSEHYVAGSIDNEHLADDAVTGAKIDSTTTVTAASFVGPLTGAVTGNADTATALATGRTISLTGDVTGTSGSFDGTGNVSITATIADDSHNHVISNVDGLQTALDGKQATITGAATTIDDTNLTASRAVVSDGSGKVAVSDVTSTELGYLDGVTSAIQTQINNKQPLDAQLTDIAGLTPTDGNFIVGDGANFVAESGATARTSLGLGSLATLNEVNAATIADNSVGAAELNVSGNGTSGQLLSSDGDGTMTWTAPPSGGIAKSVYAYRSSSTFTVPDGVNSVYVEVWGGGGDGGYSNDSFSVSGGGGGGGYASSSISVTPGQSVSVTVGGANQASSFGNYVTANGGATGSVGTGNEPGGAGGNGVGGNLALAPGNAGNAGYFSGNQVVGGDGGNSPFLVGYQGNCGISGGYPADISGNSANGIGSGGGGHGRQGGGTANAGNGAAGAVIVHI